MVLPNSSYTVGSGFVSSGAALDLREGDPVQRLVLLSRIADFDPHAAALSAASSVLLASCLFPGGCLGLVGGCSLSGGCTRVVGLGCERDDCASRRLLSANENLVRIWVRTNRKLDPSLGGRAALVGKLSSLRLCPLRLSRLLVASCCRLRSLRRPSFLHTLS